MSNTYSIAETMLTIQGEGANAGTVAFFVRMSGCNLWSGKADTRQRDSDRNGAICPMFCDTDFTPRVKLEGSDIVSLIKTHDNVPLVVFTGGEPLLQLRTDLVEEILNDTSVERVAVETNGTVELSPEQLKMTMPNRGMHKPLWITCSPKVPPSKLRIQPQSISELKVVYPAYDPRTYELWLRSTRSSAFQKMPFMYVQPEAVPTEGKIGESVLDQAYMQNAAKFCMQHPQWRLSVQTHKIVGLP